MSPSVNHHPDPYLTIVPEDAFVENDILETIVDVTEESDRVVALPPAEEHFSMEPPPQREVAPRKTSKLVVAGALGGGMVFGGGVVAALSLAAVLAVGAVGMAGAGAWWWMGSESPEAIEAPVAAPVEEDLAPVADDEGLDEAADEAAAAAPEDGMDEDLDEDAAPVDAPEDRGDREAPAAPTPAPAAPPPVTPAVPTVAPEEIPADDILVKVLSNPPAATVTIDGVPAGRTPLKTFLPAGSHNVVIESGKASGEFTIDPSSSERFCFKAKGRKVQTDACR